jgi:protein-S-isoprenylcysteine O-methyltransferase Ste14
MAPSSAMHARMMGVDLTPETTMRALWLIWCMAWMAAAIGRDRSVKRPGTRHQLLYRAFIAIGVVLLGINRRPVDGELMRWRSSDPVAWLMVALTLLGLLFTGWARLHLGRLWSSNVSRKADHHIVDTGPYGMVRHPIYTGIILATIATAALRGTVAAWLGMGLMTLGWYVKARLEEGFLREQLGAEEYASYARRVPMLIPFTRAFRS